MRSWARRAIGLGAITAIVASVGFASVAGALTPPPGEGQPTSPGTCVFAFTPAAADGAMEPGSVTVSVTQLPTIDESLTVQLFLNGNVVQSRVVAPPPGLPINFAPINVVEGDDVSVNYILRNVSTYSTVCATVAGQSVIRVRGAQATRALAFTGSSNTSTMVLLGVAAMVVGLVLVVGARRRHRVNA